MAEDTTGRGGGGKWPEGECGQDPQTGDRRQRESRVLLACSPLGFTRVDLVPPKVPASWRLEPILVLWGFIACLPERIAPCRSVFSWGYESDVPRSPKGQSSIS